MTERRGFLKSLMAGTVVGFPAVKSVEVLDVKPEDTVIISVEGCISQETAERIKQVFHNELPNQKCLVLSEGISLKVLRG